MTEFQLAAQQDFAPADSLVLLAFPAIGNAPAIAADYLRKQLDLPMVGFIRCDDLSGIVHVEDGQATSPIRIYGGETVCTLDAECPRLYVVTSPVGMPEHLVKALAQALLSVFKDAYALISLDTIPREPEDDTPDVYTIAGNPSGIEVLAVTKARPMPRAVFTGLSAELLHHGASARVGCLAVEAAPDRPDGRAAAALITCVDKLTPHVKIAAEPLREEAMQMEVALGHAVDEAAQAKARSHAHTFI